MDQRRAVALGSVVASVVASIVLASALPAAAGRQPGTVPISPVGKLAQQEQLLTPVAGDGSRVVYLETPTLGDGTPAGDSATIHQVQLGAPSTTVGPETGASDFSLAGSMLTALEKRAAAHPVVIWWDLANDTTGTARIPGRYAGAAPDGWVYTTGNSIYDESSAAGVRRIAKARRIGPNIQTATTGPNGAVVYGNAAAYVTFAGDITTLDIGPYSADRHDHATCAATTTTATACQFVDSASHQVLASERIPLDGGSPTPLPASCFAGRGNDTLVALEATQTDCIRRRGAGLTTLSTATGSMRQHRGPFDLSGGLVAALGSVVAATARHTQTALVTVPDADAAADLITGDPAARTAGAFSLTVRRLSYGDDPDSDHETVSVPVSSDRHRITPGAPTIISNRGNWSETAASGGTTIWGNGYAAIGWVDLDPDPAERIGPFVPGSLSLSGNRVIFAEPTHVPRLRLLDLRTRAIAPPAGVPSHVLSSGYVRSGLAGSFMAYAHRGSIWRVNVSSGKRAKVARAGHVTSLFVYGPYVGWNPRGKPGRWRNVDDAMGQVTTLPAGDRISSLSNNGVVFYPKSRTHAVIGNTLPSTYFLRGYTGGKARQILDAPASTAVAQVSSAVVAWLDRHHIVEAAPVNAPSTVPYSLGDPIAPPTFTLTDGNWNAKFDYSTAITGCGVTISRHHRPLRVVACSAENLPLGVVAIAWDGKDSNGKTVPAGHYTWTVTVGDKAGLGKQHSGGLTVK